MQSLQTAYIMYRQVEKSIMMVLPSNKYCMPFAFWLMRQLLVTGELNSLYRDTSLRHMHLIVLHYENSLLGSLSVVTLL